MSRIETLTFVSLAHFFDHFFLLIFPTAAIAIADEWNISFAAALALGTPIYVAFAIGTLPAGWLGDRFDRLKLLVVFLFGCGASSLLVALSTGPVTLMAALGLLGLFASLYHPVGTALVTEIAQRRGRALAINGVFGNLGLAGAAVMTGFLAEHGGWQSAFLVPGLASMLAGGTLVLRHRNGDITSHQEASQSTSSVEDTTQRTQLIVFAVVCVSALFGGLVFNGVTVSLPKFFDERVIMLEGNLSWIGAYTGLVFAVAALAQLPVGELLDRFGARPVLLSLLVAQVVLLVALAQAQGWIAIVLALGLVTLIFAEIPITGWLLGRYVRSGLRSRAMSVEYVLALGVGSAAIPIMAGMHYLGMGFDIQLLGLAVSVLIILLAASNLPRLQAQQATAAQLSVK